MNVPTKKGGEGLGISKGTKLTNNPKNLTIKIRLDEDTASKLDFLANSSNTTKSEVIRKGIEIQFEQQKK